MRKGLLSWCLMIIVVGLFAGCAQQPEKIDEGNLESEYSSTNSMEDGMFRLSLYLANKQLWANEPIDIYSTLEFIGDTDTVTIWHGNPYIIYTLYDDQGVCYTNAIIQTVLESTTITKGDLMTFNFQKSGGWSTDDPNAEYWEAFYSDPELKLPKGKYTLSVGCAFGLSEEGQDYHSNIETEFEVE